MTKDEALGAGPDLLAEGSRAGGAEAADWTALERMAAGLARDFNNLLTTIFGHTEMLAETARPSDTQHIAEIREAARRAALLGQQLLTVSGRQFRQPRPTDVNALVLGLATAVADIAGDDIEATIEVDDRLGRVCVDPAELERTILAVVTNARDAMPRGGRLTLTTSRTTVGDAEVRAEPDLVPGEYAAVVVRDTGIGVDAETRKHMFEPYFTTHAHGRRAGLGLALVRGAMRRSDGAVEVVSEPGRGTTIRLYLPLLGP